jgi:hypothetical protein
MQDCTFNGCKIELLATAKESMFCLNRVVMGILTILMVSRIIKYCCQ